MQRTVTCAFIKEDGTPCRAAPLTNDEFCISHTKNPEAIAKKAIGSRKGGKVKARPDAIGSWEYRQIDNTEDLRQGMSELFNAGMLGKIPTSQLSALSQAAAVLLRLLEPPKDEGKDPDSVRRIVLRFLDEQAPEMKSKFLSYLENFDAQ